MTIRRISLCRRLTVLVAALLSTALPARAADEPFEIYVVTSLSGPIAFLGTEAAKGLGLVESIVNKQGGIGGRPVKFVIQDDQSSPQVAVQLMSQAQAKGAQVVLDAAALSSCLAAAGLIKDDGPVLFCTTSGVHPPAGSYIFATVPSTLWQFEAAMRFYRMQGLTKIAVIGTTDATGQDTDKTIDAVAALPENRAVTITNHEHMTIGDLSVTAQIERIKSAGAQAIIAGTTGAAFGTILRGMRDAAIDLPIISSGGNLSYKQMEGFTPVMPRGAVYVMGFPAYAPDVVPIASVRRAVDQMSGAMKANNMKAEIGAVIAWDAAFVMVDALRKKGTKATAAQLREYISNLRGYPGVFGMLDYRAVPQSGVSKDWILVLRWDDAADRFVAVSKPGGDPLTGKR
jgi:branched-chain amino acid transport system substrate-binding protein